MRKPLIAPTIFTALISLIFLVYYISIKNYEFSGYIVVISILYLILIRLDKKYSFPPISIWLFSIWLLLHMLGGSIYISQTKLYDLLLLNIFNGGGEFVILKYDQLIHAYCYLAFSIIIFFMLKKHFRPDQTTILIIFSILAASGIGMLNEIIEFAMVVFADAAKAVGGYYNTALDLVFNLIGAIIGSLMAPKIKQYKQS